MRPLRWLGQSWAVTAWVALALLCLAYPLLFREPFYQRMGALVLLAAISATAWNLVGGMAGQASFGHAMFFGVGAYLPLLVYKHWQAPPPLGIPLGVAAALAIALAIGIPTFRLVGHYFSMATIAVAELLRIVISNWDFVGAAIGLSGPAVARTLWDFSFRSSIPYHYLFLAVLALELIAVQRVRTTRMGYYLRAIRHGERAARSLGVPVRRYKLYALLWSAAFTSLAGSLYALMIGFADPDSAFGILISVEMVIVAALGGAGTLVGPLIGAVILIPLQNVSNSLFGGSGTGLTFLVYGGIILLIARFEPGGLVQLWIRRFAARTRAAPQPEVSRAA